MKPIKLLILFAFAAFSAACNTITASDTNPVTGAVLTDLKGNVLYSITRTTDSNAVAAYGNLAVQTADVVGKILLPPEQPVDDGLECGFEDSGFRVGEGGR